MKALLLSALLALSPLFAVAGMVGGQIGVSLTILPSCKIDAAHSGTSVTCASRTMMQPHISEMMLTAVPGISMDSKLVTVEW
ncbi:hypothetical protein [Rahnella]|jgi:hypothetical protein|uniref:Uncharacterized protein n=1 Tax=Rahnella victoriana TaxID=1510570 RepID=A0ABS0DMX7_9GAMM|nr:hypothetical protein [Rahnella]VTQ53581.1 Uncharacterised protein [Campylobacter jejuni]MBF7954372.1 hypothetical protein [Rahnella victoriana]PBI81889.1 hypothetical protein A9993_20170 [Rahnella victoriana]TBX31375.1 hypothetical protein EYY67_22200 [Rahnella victoriana]TDS92516.1 hypothetical protein EDF78_10534 [Rahnella sp. BIGb0236]